MNWTGEAAVPPAVVTLTFTVPVPAGAVAMIPSGVTKPKVAGVEPKSTAVTVDRPVPAIVTVVPPVEGPSDGAMEDTVGAAT